MAIYLSKQADRQASGYKYDYSNDDENNGKGPF